MTKLLKFRLLTASLILIASSAGRIAAQTPAPDMMMSPKLAPKFDDVYITVPTAEELKSCKVEFVKGSVPKSGGWLLMDAKGTPIRGFFDTTGKVNDKGQTTVDTWRYYKDGIEVYREFDTTGTGKPNNFRWLNGGGMKWGIGGLDAKSGKWSITAWRMISAEEVGFEAFMAVSKNDLARLEALFITDADMQAIKLPAAKSKAIGTAQAEAAKKFAGVVQNAKLTGAKFDGVEGATPSCDTSTDVDIIKFSSRAVRYLSNDKHAWIHTGEMIQVGMAWRLVDVPSLTDINHNEKPLPMPVANKDLQDLLNALAELDKSNVGSANLLEKNAKVEAYYRKRIELVSKIIPLDKESEREVWYKQLFDNMTAMAQNTGDDASMAMLTKMRENVEANSKTLGVNLAAYGAYRDMWTRYAVGVAKNPSDMDVNKLTEKWLEDLAGFVSKYKKADDTPDALWQLAMGSEFAGKTAESKRWYKELGDSFPDSFHAPRAKGSLARLNLVGNKMTLNAPLLGDAGKMFDIESLKGKVVIVHYWSTASTTHVGDFAVLKQKVASAKNVELVCISLDDDGAKARDAVVKAQVPGIHLWQAAPNNAGSLGSPLAIQYGIHILPTLFIIDRDGRVTNNSVQVADIDTELKKVQ